ncbi:MAG: hypothetical protein IJN75_02200 [Clostridia bacterium]|nr:hypothetical protein [Clostridia bacterium]
MIIKKIGKIIGGQDGAVCGTELFRFDTKGKCTVFDLSELDHNEEKILSPKSVFFLDKLDLVTPHSNAVFFGTEYYDVTDTYPILYTNVYNNYSASNDKRMGMLLAYRLQKINVGYKTTLLQIIKIGFTEDIVWKSNEKEHGVRPYGNFVAENGLLFAFVMRNEENGTRFFKFKLPSVRDGEASQDGVAQLVLEKTDILEYFDLPYFRFVQGATMHNGKIYSTEGFTGDTLNQPAIRVIDTKTKTEVYYNIMKQGYPDEAEMIDHLDDKCLYSDINGNLYACDFD